MTKKEIFKQVIRTMREDSATKKDTLGADPELFLARLDEEMTEEAFCHLVNTYLASFGVLVHVGFGLKERQPLGFSLRFWEGVLYVVRANEATGLQKGDKILTLDGVSIAEIAQKEQDFFVSKTPERQYMQWGKLVKRAERITVKRKGIEKEVTVQSPFELAKAESFLFEQLTPDTVYLKVENFSDEDGITNLHKESSQAIQSSKNLIIDVRVNHGGSDVLFAKFLEYGLPVGKTLSDYEQKEDEFGMEILYTERNVDMRLQQMTRELENTHITPETAAFIGAFMSKLKEHRGQGFVLWEDDSEEIFDLSGTTFPENVLVLADVACGSSGDNFVAIMKTLPKVTVMGRPTMGILDYSNCCTLDLGDYYLIFPTSRWLAVDAGKGMTDKGILPDITIPWAPEHLEHDVDLEEALKYLEKSD